ncbi:MAG: DUF924 family protein [Gammaproteobacteria bacterium]
MKPVEVIDYWYSKKVRDHWFSSTPELDAEILTKFESIWEQAVEGKLDKWQNTASGCLALILIYDQFPLNMFRGEARSFQTEKNAIAVARIAINSHFIPQLQKEQLVFLFMPFMHSEEIKEQDLAIALYREHQLEGNLEFAQHHRAIVRQFGRFPHRNQILGRKSTAEELEYLRSKDAFIG